MASLFENTTTTGTTGTNPMNTTGVFGTFCAPPTTTLLTPELDRATAALVLAKAQSLQNKAKHEKEMLRRSVVREEKRDAEVEEARAARAPSRKRDREYEDALSAVEHTDRLMKLNEKQENDTRTRKCTIERKTLRHGQVLAQNVLYAQKTKELNALEYERLARVQEFEMERQKIMQARKIARLQLEASQTLQDERMRQNNATMELEFKNQRRAIKKHYNTTFDTDEVVQAENRVTLFEKYGLSLPEKLFE